VHQQARQAVLVAIDQLDQRLRIGAAQRIGAERARGLYAPLDHRVVDRLVLAQGPDAGGNLRFGVIGRAGQELARRRLHDRRGARLVALLRLALDLVDGGDVDPAGRRKAGLFPYPV
jgi:hypothetical protein